MRKLNMFLAAGMLLTFLAHGIMGSFKLIGAEVSALKTLAWVCVGLVCLHIIVTTILMCETLRARKLSGAGYFKDNLIFWARRISGFTILIPLLLHLFIFSGRSVDGAFRLTEFTAGRLISQLLLVLTIAFHVLTNIEPMMISFGVKSTKAFSHDAIFVVSVVLLLACAAFGAYYLRWITL